MPWRARLAISISQFANRLGIYLGPRSTRIHVAFYRWSGGKIGGHFPGWPPAQILLVDHIGAKSGTRRTSPVMYHRQGDWFAIAASKAGQPTNPAWFHNLKANPETTVQIGAEQRHVRARVATDQERDVLWPMFVAFYPGYEFFQRNARARTIPIVILEPRESGASGASSLAIGQSEMSSATGVAPGGPQGEAMPDESHMSLGHDADSAA